MNDDGPSDVEYQAATGTTTRTTTAPAMMTTTPNLSIIREQGSPSSLSVSPQRSAPTLDGIEQATRTTPPRRSPVREGGGASDYLLQNDEHYHHTHTPSTSLRGSDHLLQMRGSSKHFLMDQTLQVRPEDEWQQEEDTPDDEKHRKDDPYPSVRNVLCCFGLFLGVILCFIELGGDHNINRTLAIAVWMGTLWLTEVIPLVVTALTPLFLFPLFGILTSATVAMQYANNTIFLLISGFLIALTLERWNLHRRFSLKILTFCGVQPQLLLLGMMGSTFVLSMFISNTATTLMMVPNALSIIQLLEEHSASSSSTKEAYADENRRFAVAIMLGLAYSANVGGMSSLIGTASNLVFQYQLEVIFPDAPEFTFADWLGFGLPIGLLIFFIVWGYLSMLYLRNFQSTSLIDPSMFTERYQALGPWTREQVVVTILFVLEGLLWTFRRDLILESIVIPGWSNMFPDPTDISDATVGMFIACLLFVTPASTANLAEEYARNHDEDDDKNAKAKKTTKTTLLDWATANKMPYDVVFLLGGGFALAKGFVASGLSAYIGSLLAMLQLSLGAMLFLVIFLMIWLTEITSNTSTSNIMIPIAAALAVASQTNPYTFMIPVTLACSCAFVLPIATPPNMVVFSTGRLPLREMNRAGVLLNLISAVVLLVAAFTIIPIVTRERATSFPPWAADNGDDDDDAANGNP